MKTVRQILKEKGHLVWHISPDALVFDALKVMADKDVGALLVMENGQLVGIFSERDYARKVILKGKSSHEITVGEIMTSHVIYGSLDQTNEQALALMSAKQFRHLPIFDGDNLVGIVSMGDLVKSIINDQKNTIKQLEEYILEYTSIT